MNEFSLRTVCNALLEELQSSIGGQNLVRLNVDMNLTDQFEGQSSQLTQPIHSIATFLANNLVNGVIVIDVFQKSQSGALVTIQVNVTGNGTPEAGISTQYKSADRLLVEMQTLGQALIHKINIEVEEDRILLSFTATLKDAQQKENKKESDLKNKRVLIAEDNEINVMVFSSFLNEWGVVYTIAENGQEAINRLKENEYDAVLMDIHMPVMDGIEAIRQLREFKRDIPVIVLSASTHQQAIKEAFDVGANEYLKKPVSSQELYLALTTYLQAH